MTNIKSGDIVKILLDGKDTGKIATVFRVVRPLNRIRDFSVIHATREDGELIVGTVLHFEKID